MNLNDYQTQLYVFAGISFCAIIILLIFVVILFVQVNRLMNEVKKSKAGQFQFQSPEIHPNEELARRGFRQFPNINSR